MSSQDEKEKMSFQEKSQETRGWRNNKINWRLVISNTAAALVIIIVVLSVKALVIDRDSKKQGQPDSVATSGAEMGTPSPTAAAAAAAVATTEPVGADRWIRKDLDPSKPMVALTFDDGPYTKVTRKILKALKQNGGRATFFIVGNRVDMYSETLQMAYEQGNQIGSHTYDHKDIRQMSVKEIEKELGKTDSKVKKVIGCETTALRPPYGNVNKRMSKTIKVPMIYWSIDSEDWRSRDVKQIMKRCKSVQDGDIILFHDLYPTTAAAMKKLVPRLVKRGYQLVTVDEMFYYKQLDVKGGEVYYNGRQEKK